MPWDMSPPFNIKFSVEVILWGSSFSKPLSFSPCETVAQDLRVSKGQRDTKGDRNKRKGWDQESGGCWEPALVRATDIFSYGLSVPHSPEIPLPCLQFLRERCDLKCYFPVTLPSFPSWFCFTFAFLVFFLSPPNLSLFLLIIIFLNSFLELTIALKFAVIYLYISYI